MKAGNILSEDTKLGRVVDRAEDNVVLERPKDEQYKIHNLSVLREIAKKRNLPYYGSKSQVMERLVAWDNINKK